MSDRETLRIIDRALWVDHGDGNLDGLTPELPIWADEWAERIVAAVNGRRVITDPAEAAPIADPAMSEWVRRIRAAALYTGQDDHEDLRSVLDEYRRWCCDDRRIIELEGRLRLALSEVDRAVAKGIDVMRREFEGWRPSAHEIAEPNELPIGSIVLRDGNAWQRGKQCWWMAGTRAKWDKPHGSGPITALYIPTEEAGE
ncbi:hypothetical protein ACWDSF_06150 [Nocardia beijingensis]